MNAYQKFSYVYDKLMYDCDYTLWSQYLISNVFGKGVDLACGSGKITIPLKKSGLDVYGVDISQDMLKMANENARKEGVKINFIQSDLTTFPKTTTLDFATLVIDGLNYVNGKKIPDFFKRVYDSLNSGGKFIFDVSTEYKLTEYIANNFFYEDSDDITYLWTNKMPKNKAYVNFELSFFVKEGEKYSRFDESHKLYVHKDEFLRKCLIEAGFEIKEVLNDKLKPLGKTKSMRALYHAVKK
ncbi:MAG: class I SAM-dependent methyltransferase [Clostridia bacterium]|nr:class I SAM-dependent methyltransferase [Clostridia bacterium]